MATVQVEYKDNKHGVLIDGYDMDKLSDELLQYVLDVASGKKTKQEELAARDIAIFKDGVTL
ncbi:MAG: UxaA family hydrolase [Lachnospiraceae bacterium]|nr:UxaA family hydrolase [Lachnospiraceae bacterium]